MFAFDDTLQLALQAAAKVTKNAGPIAIIGTVKLEGTGRKAATLTAYDLAQRLTIDLTSDDRTGKREVVVIDHKPLLKLLRSASNADAVTINTFGDVALTDDGSPVVGKRVEIFPPVDFPPGFDPWGADHAVTMTAGQLSRAIERTAFAMSTEPTRYYLTGIALHPVNGLLRFVATDGHRLALHAMQTIDPVDFGADVVPIVPRDTVETLRALFRKLTVPEAAVKIELSRKYVRFTCGMWTLESKLIDGSFPDYTRLLPGPEAGAVMAFDRGDLIAALRRIGKGYCLLTPGDGAVKLAVGERETTCAMEGDTAGHLPIAFDAAYWLSIANAMPEGRINVSHAGKTAGDCMAFRPEADPEPDERYLALCMAVRHEGVTAARAAAGKT